MSGKIVSVVPKVRLDFSAVAGGQTQRVVLTPGVPRQNWKATKPSTHCAKMQSLRELLAK